MTHLSFLKFSPIQSMNCLHSFLPSRLSKWVNTQFQFPQAYCNCSFFPKKAFATFQTAAKTGGTAAAAVGSRVICAEQLSSAWTGFFAGCLHTLSGPAHLAALALLSIGRTRRGSAVVEGLWGCRHDAGQVIWITISTSKGSPPH